MMILSNHLQKKINHQLTKFNLTVIIKHAVNMLHTLR